MNNDNITERFGDIKVEGDESKMNEKCFVIKRLFFRENKTTGSIWKRVYYPEGSVNQLYGCRFIGQALEESKNLLPGDRIQILDGEVQTMADDSSNWERLLIRSFEKLRGGGGEVA